MAEVVVHLPSKYKALSSIPNTTKLKKKKVKKYCVLRKLSGLQDFSFSTQLLFPISGGCFFPLSPQGMIGHNNLYLRILLRCAHDIRPLAPSPTPQSSTDCCAEGKMQ
jgi:hypothetical protein